MFDTIFWAVIGTLSGVIFGVIPGAGPFVATATLYPFLTHIEPVNVYHFLHHNQLQGHHGLS